MQPALLRFQLHLFRHAMRAENGDAVRRDFGQILDELGAARLQRIDDPFVVHNFVPHVDRGAVLLQSALNDLDGAHNPRAKPARLSKNHSHPPPPLTPRRSDSARRPEGTPAACAGWRPGATLNASNTLPTMPFASRPARAYIAAGES